MVAVDVVADAYDRSEAQTTDWDEERQRSADAVLPLNVSNLAQTRRPSSKPGPQQPLHSCRCSRSWHVVNK
jgi:hypothetical protein